MKFIKNFLNRLVSIFSLIPIYLRGIAIFSFIFIISIIFKKMNTPEYFIGDGSDSYIVLEENAIHNVKKQNSKIVDKNNLNENIEIDKKNNLIKGTVKENLKSSAPTIKTLKANKKQQKKEETSNSVYLKSFINDYVIGNPQAPVSIVEYSNFKCPHCISFHKENMEKIKANYIDTGKVKYIKRIIIQKDTLLGVMLPYCARKEFKYSTMNDLFNNVDTWINSSTQSKRLKEIATRNGFNSITYESCIKDEKLAKKLLNKQNIELKELNIFSTPTIFINIKKYKGGKDKPVNSPNKKLFVYFFVSTN